MSDYKNKGIFFKNDYKNEDSHPDYKGKLNVEGKDFEIAGWIREGKKGKFMSLAVNPPYKKEPEKATNDPADDLYKDSDETILPF